ncbi:UDP-glucose 4-epimerase GalE [Candidatus Endobugula sertula]|uniref:UDP-glucose 4-epimerase n=1 Tax=Candidatus Endobugula sertula TaxID=62101 RepID=A0A1D2QT99_9GAMM|nr:UDP-glucose 4-epimerase GalE [Candidatus Endobugula sertula]
MSLTVLVTGGAGYIGSHACVELLNAGYQVVVFDNLCNSRLESLERVKKITGKSLPFVSGDVRNRDDLRVVFSQFTVSAVIHFAGLKAVGESAQIPLHYYDVNVAGSIALVEVMEEFQCQNLVFSSSATVYGADAETPYVETLPTAACNVYGRTKLMVEDILRDHCNKPESHWRVSLLRYFNPIGAHSSGLIGEDPQGIPNNLLPYVAQVAIGRLEQLLVFGGDYPTPDGTGIRDYIHVVDLARGHVKAVDHILQAEVGCRVYNLGTGKGYSVLDVVKAFEQVCGKTIPYKIASRREGDLASYYADASLVLRELGWKAEYDLKTMVEDTWRWQSRNPEGYKA